MTEKMEPPVKKAKMAENTTIVSLIENVINSKKNLQAVLDNSLSNPIPLIKVFVGHVKDPKEISRMFQTLNEKIPLNALQHLKRVRKRNILLCPKYFLNPFQQTIQEYIEQNVSELKDCFEYFKVVDVPLSKPESRRQYMECSKYWSVNFHPNKYLERLLSNDFFREDELRGHRLYMGMALEVTKWYLRTADNVSLKDICSRNVNAAIVVDPTHRSVVAVAFDNREDHPLQHAAMLAIDNVAKTQNGGAWSTCGNDGTLAGIDEDLLMHLKGLFPDVKFGAKQFVGKGELKDSEDSEGPYLCTGYCVYLVKEPCVMCSMGLVHARTKRVFFCLDSEKHGALKSVTKLQQVESLNHHFEVFTGFL